VHRKVRMVFTYINVYVMVTAGILFVFIKARYIADTIHFLVL